MKPQTSDLVLGKLKSKVLRKSICVALHRQIQRFGGDTVQSDFFDRTNERVVALRDTGRKGEGVVVPGSADFFRGIARQPRKRCLVSSGNLAGGGNRMGAFARIVVVRRSMPTRAKNAPAFE